MELNLEACSPSWWEAVFEGAHKRIEQDAFAGGF